MEANAKLAKRGGTIFLSAVILDDTFSVWLKKLIESYCVFLVHITIIGDRFIKAICHSRTFHHCYGAIYAARPVAVTKWPYTTACHGILLKYKASNLILKILSNLQNIAKNNT